MSGSDAPTISVIIPTYNRAAELPELIQALQQQSLPAEQFEVLIVDDGSTDGAREYLRGLRGNITALEQAHGGASKARNLAASRARGRILAFTDDDCRPEREWLEIISRRMATNAYRVALLGQTFSEYPASTFVHSVFKDSEPVVTCNFACSKEAFKQAGGFDEHFILYFEDEDLGLRLKKSGFPIIFESRMRVLHPSRYQSYRRFLRLRSGLQYLCYMSQKHPDGDHWQRHCGVVKQIWRKALLFGIPLLGAVFWPPILGVLAMLLLVHFTIDGQRAWRHRSMLAEAGFPLRLADLAAFALLTWFVPFLDGYRILKGCLRDRGKTQPWTPEVTKPVNVFPSATSI